MIDQIAKLPIVKSHYKGKVRDVLDIGDNLLIITSDRVSAFDVVFPNEITGKGIVLNTISSYFFKKTSSIIKNHFISDNVDDLPKEFHEFKNFLTGRVSMVKKTKVIPFECICRGYISGSAWEEYKKSKTVGGLLISEDLKQSQKFSQTLFTPSTKASEGHDENISYNAMSQRMDLIIAETLKNKSIELFNWAHDFFMSKGIILADTKFEFGTIGNEIYLIDEIFTPDSSRFWVKDEYEIGVSPKSYDKQFIRDYLLKIGWDKTPPAPDLPPEIVNNTIKKYETLASLVLK